MADTSPDPLALPQQLLEGGRGSEARAAARTALAELPASADPLLVGSLQLIEIRAALDMGPATEDLARISRLALDNVRGNPDTETHARLCQLRIALDLHDEGAARDALHWLNERRRRLAPEPLAQLILIEVQLAPSLAAACEHLRRGAAQLPAGPEQLEVRLVLAHLQLRHGQATEPLDDLVRAAIGESDHRQVASALESLGWTHHQQLPAATLQRVIDWARERTPHVSGFLLAQIGRVDEAIELLTAASHTATEFVRGRCLHALLPLLKNGPERRRCVDELEVLLDRDDDPASRHDLALAQAQLAGSERDVELMERALANARRAAPSLADGTELVVNVLAELIGLRSRRPTAELAKLGTELMRLVLSTGSFASAEAELSAAISMTMMGPVCHPDVIGAAAALAALAAPRHEHEKTRDVVQARCVWLIERQRGVQSDPGEWPKGPFDEAPQWLIDLTLGVERSVTPDELRVGHELLSHVVDARPDIADPLISALIPAWEAASGSWVAELEASINDSIETSVCPGPDAWPKLSAAIRAALARSSRAWLHGLAASIARARGEAPPSIGMPTQSRSTSEQLRMLFAQARQASEHVRELSWGNHEQETQAARTRWREVLALAEQHGERTMLFHTHVGLGNALRWGNNPELEEALAHYRAAAALAVDQPEALAKLWKVWGDCLFERGGDDDLREAERLIARSIENRSGRLRAESLLSAERVAARHPDLNEEARLRRAIQHMMDAVRTYREFGDQVVPVLCERIAKLRRHVPRGHGTDDLLGELEQRYPGHRPLIGRARQGVGNPVDSASAGSVLHMMSDPDTRVVSFVVSKLSDPEQRIAQTPPQVLQVISIEQLRKQLEADSIRSDPERLRAELAQLRAETAEEGATGRLAAQALVIGQLVRLQQCDESQARQATAAARQALRNHPSAQTRVLIGMLLAETWQSMDQSNTLPMSDIDLSREIAAEAVDAAGGVDRAVSDLIVLLARGHRYARTGDRNEHLRRARDLYAGLHARARASGNGDDAALALHHQVDAEQEMADGDRVTRLRAGIDKLKFARTLAQMPVRVAEIEISIAWYMTLLADYLGGDEQRTLLEQAMARFDAVDRNAAPAAANLDHLRSVCHGSLEHIRRGPQAEIDHWEAQLADGSLSPYDRAITQHNLAIRIRRVPWVTSEHVLRALVLFDAAARVREPVSARHAWETCFEAGLMLVQALKSEHGLSPELLPWEQPVAILQARDWLERALKAATQLGPGEELVDAAVMLGRLAFDVRGFDSAAEIAERSWNALRCAAPYLLFRDDLRADEARFCRALAVRLAGLALEDGIVGVGNNRARAIDSERSELIVRWLLRAQASARRPTLARIQRPETATVAWWSSWQATLDRRDHRELARLLEELHAQEPDYLTGEPVLDETWAWLAAEPDAIAIAVALEGTVAVCAVLHLDERGARQMRVLLLPSPTPPGDEAQLVEHVKHAIVGDPTALAVHEMIVKWARGSIVSPILEYLGRAPKTVLWCPGPILRLATPSSVWAGVAVACVHSLALPRYRRPKQRARSSLIAAAMPNGDGMVGKVEEEAKTLLNEAKRSGSARALVSAGDVYGKRLRKLNPIRDTPASPEDLLAEVPNHDLVVVLAHGGAGSEDKAALGCVKHDGTGVLLTGKDLAAHHDAFVGATVILLACSAGRIGGELHTPDGVAGALLAAGAHAVIAPLWTVYLGIATHAAQALLRGFSKKRKPWQVLAELPARVIEIGPALDEPSDANKRAGRVVQLQSFVVWLG